MNKEFIPYEQALELKELGFDEYCYAKYNRKEFQHNSLGGNINYNDISYGNNLISAPLYQQVFRWFREKYGWIGGIRNLDRKKPMIVADFVKDEDNLFMIWADNYEDAELKALKELIERIKNK